MADSSALRSPPFSGTVPAEKARSRVRRFFNPKNVSLLGMALPGIVQIFIFAYLPMFGLVIAFKDYRFNLGIFGSQWVGFDNFRFLFSRGVAWRITYNTVFLNALFISTTLVVSLIVALLLNEIHRSLAARFYQTALFLPYFISWVIAGYFVFGLLSMSPMGWVNRLMVAVGLEPIRWYNSPQYWPGILTLTNLWKGIGFWSIIYLAGIVGINPEYYEVATIDGAGKLQQIRYITLPLLMPLVIINLLLQVGRIFYADFGLFFNVTQDRAMLYKTTDVIDTFVYRSLRQISDIGMAAAAGFYQAVVGLILIGLVNWLVRRIDRDKALF